MRGCLLRYIDFSGIRTLIGKREKVEFAQTVYRYDRKFRGLKTAKRDLIVTQKGIFIIGREPVKSGPNKGQMQESVSRNIPFQHLFQVSPRFFEKKNLYQYFLYIIKLRPSKKIKKKSGNFFFLIFFLDFFFQISTTRENLDFFSDFYSVKE